MEKKCGFSNRTEYIPLDEGERARFENMLAPVLHSVFVVDGGYMIVFMNVTAKKEFPNARLASRLKLTPKLSVSDDSIYAVSLYGKGCVVFTWHDKKQRSDGEVGRELLIISAIPDDFSYQGEMAEYIKISYEQIRRSTSLFLNHFGELSEEERRKFKKTTLIVSENIKRNEKIKKLVLAYLLSRESHGEDKPRALNIGELIAAFQRVSAPPLKAIGRNLICSAGEYNISVATRSEFMFMLICVLDFCLCYSHGDISLCLKEDRETGHNLVIFSVNDKYGAYEVYKRFSLDFGKETLRYCATHAFIPLAIANSICRSFGYVLEERTEDGMLIITVRMKASETLPEKLLRQRRRPVPLSEIDFDILIYSSDDIDAAARDISVMLCESLTYDNYLELYLSNDDIDEKVKMLLL